MFCESLDDLQYVEHGSRAACRFAVPSGMCAKSVASLVLYLAWRVTKFLRHNLSICDAELNIMCRFTSPLLQHIGLRPCEYHRLRPNVAACSGSSVQCSLKRTTNAHAVTSTPSAAHAVQANRRRVPCWNPVKTATFLLSVLGRHMPTSASRRALSRVCLSQKVTLAHDTCYNGGSGVPRRLLRSRITRLCGQTV